MGSTDFILKGSMIVLIIINGFYAINKLHQPMYRLKKMGNKKTRKAPRAGASRRFVDDIFPTRHKANVGLLVVAEKFCTTNSL
jgi:hypothetical protein